MKFKDIFKKGDVICSDKFRYGRLMIVDEFKTGGIFETVGYYSCTDFFDKNQGWCANEFSNWNENYNWKIATDEDYIREIEKRLYIGKSIGVFGETVEVDNHHLWIQNDNDSIGLTPNQALQLADFIYEKIERA
jgi:hypothetical protein